VRHLDHVRVVTGADVVGHGTWWTRTIITAVTVTEDVMALAERIVTS
jgi:hypothetical protein